MAQRAEHHPLQAAFAALLAIGLDSAAAALRILVHEAIKIERAQFLNAQPYARSSGRTHFANRVKPKTAEVEANKAMSTFAKTWPNSK